MPNRAWERHHGALGSGQARCQPLLSLPQETPGRGDGPEVRSLSWGQQDVSREGKGRAALLAGLAAQGSLPRSQGTDAPAVPVKFCSPLLKDKSVYNKGRERAGCQANKLGGKFFYLILCAQFPVSLQKAI